MFELSEVPELVKGKGNKLISLSNKGEHEETLNHVILLKQKQSLQLVAGRRKYKLSPHDLDHFLGERGKRGSKLPKGMQAVTSLSALN